jgi:hypothetical protein
LFPAVERALETSEATAVGGDVVGLFEPGPCPVMFGALLRRLVQFGEYVGGNCAKQLIQSIWVKNRCIAAALAGV